MFSFLLGAYTIVGFEAAANLAEETQDAHRVVPFAMWSAVVLSGVVGFLFLIALNLTSGNIPALSASTTPVADIVREVLGTVVGDIFLVIVTFSIFACGLVIFMTATRLTWAMSRDRRFPGYPIFRQVNRRTGTPIATTLLSGIFCEVVLAIFANQANSLTNLFSASTLLPAIIYLCTVILYIYARRKLPADPWISALVCLNGRLSCFRWSGCSLNWRFSAMPRLLRPGPIVALCLQLA